MASAHIYRYTMSLIIQENTLKSEFLCPGGPESHRGRDQIGPSTVDGNLELKHFIASVSLFID